jgi:predicted P-loop ATPase
MSTGVRNYLEGLVWDGRARIDMWLIECAGAEDTIATRDVSRALLVAAVHRVLHPGCRFDQVPLFMGPQGSGKSAALRMLAVHDEWFGNDLPFDSSAKHFMEATVGKWIVEAGELMGMSQTDAASFKACLSRQVDVSRASWDHRPRKTPRQFVIVGTTNETEACLLLDPTILRRFWPVQVKRFDLAKLREIRDQLWAEAVVVEATGAS